MEIRVDIPMAAPMVITEAARRGLLKGGELILAAAVEGAPREDEPRHGEHMTETGYRRLLPDGTSGEASEAVEVGFTAFWALWQELDDDYEHEQGHAHFLERASVEHGEAALAVVAETVRSVIGD